MALIRIAAPLRRQAVAQLRLMISEQVFRPGERLIERDLCERLEVSRTIVREALRQLEAEGLVQTIPDRGPIVAKLSPKDTVNLYEIRALLEGLAARKFVANASVKQRRQLMQAYKRLEQAFDRGDPKLVARVKIELYAVITEGAGSEILSETLRQLQSRIGMLRLMTLSSAGRLPQARREVEAIIKAIERNDGEAAFAASIEHVESASRVAQRIVTGQASQRSPSETEGKP